jgi:hypothetical protein
MADANSLGTSTITDCRIVRYRIAVAVLSVACLGLLVLAILQLQDQPESPTTMRVLSPDAIMEALDTDLKAIRLRRSRGSEVEEVRRLDAEERVARILAAIELNAVSVFAGDAAIQADAEAHLSSIFTAMSFSTASEVTEAFTVPEVMRRARASPLFALKVNTFLMRQTMMKRGLEVDAQLECKMEEYRSRKAELEMLQKLILEKERGKAQ